MLQLRWVPKPVFLFECWDQEIGYFLGFLGMAKKEDTIVLEGRVEELLPGMHFRVMLENGVPITAHLCGKMRMSNIRLLVGDRVTVEMSTYDLTKARVVYRHR